MIEKSQTPEGWFTAQKSVPPLTASNSGRYHFLNGGPGWGKIPHCVRYPRRPSDVLWQTKTGGNAMRGTAEQWIKEVKYALNWTRLSCHDFVANQVRLQLFALAYIGMAPMRLEKSEMYHPLTG